ncbi:MAG: bacterioferritin [Bdellovibrionaceae bacterium]|nr:bacterioferritin [Bdellovibrionales bacterium]MCB9084587.1 bacterioferritin [Pseudobdellovibrionaceae bacterium]
MKGHADIIAMLNEVLCGELTAINQYFLHARMCKDWGYNKIGDVIYHESIDEMKHAKEVTDRILFLEGLPNLQKLETLEIGEKVPEMLKNDLRLEERAIPRLKKGIELCQKHSDHGTRHLLEEILRDEERHVDWLESQLHIIGEVGVENYLTEQFKAGEMS